MGRRNIPLHHTAVAAHAKAISELEVGEAWVRRFRTWHPDLKAKWTTGQEKCRAGAFNKPTVTELYNTFEELKAQYNIKAKNTHNMDEKGCQLGVGGRIKALIDINQKDAQKIEDGNRELITIIECVCADGTMIRPNVVFQGKRHNMEWGRVNPCDARWVNCKLVIAFNNETYYLIASHTLRRDGQTKNSAWSGSSETLNYKHGIKIPTSIDYSFLMDITPIPLISSAPLLKSTRLSSCVYHPIPVFNLVMSEFLDHWAQHGKRRLMLLKRMVMKFASRHLSDTMRMPDKRLSPRIQYWEHGERLGFILLITWLSQR